MPRRCAGGLGIGGGLVAIKLIRADAPEDEVARERFRREARAVARINRHCKGANRKRLL